MRTLTTSAPAHLLPGDTLEVMNVLWNVDRVLSPTSAILSPMPTAHVMGTGAIIAEVLEGMLYVAALRLLDNHDNRPVKPGPEGVTDDCFVTCICRQCFAACRLTGTYDRQ